jgi:adenosine/AMP kinase
MRKANALRKAHALESEDSMLEMKSVRMDIPQDANIIVGQAHFIKTVEDLYEAVATTVPQAKETLNKAASLR